MRLFVAAALLLLLTAGCGGTKTVTVGEVQRAFAAHGQAFQTEQLPNPNLRPRRYLWPRYHDVDAHVKALLSSVDNTSLSTLLVWVFDSPANAEAALKRTPDVARRPNTVVIRRGNLVVAASKNREEQVRAALDSLF